MKERIKEVRKKYRMTQEQFAGHLGIKRGAIANYEIGRNVPTDSVIALICREFSVSEKWLRTGEGEMTVQKPENELGVLMDKYHVSQGMKLLIGKLVELPPAQQEAVTDFIVGVAEEIAATGAGAHIPREKTIDELVEEYRKSLEEEKERKEKSEAS